MQKVAPESIKDRKLVKVKIADLDFDPLNPNKMTEIEEYNLAESFKRWGKLDPIKISERSSKTGKYKIGDGEHRATVLRNLGQKEIDAYIIPEINNDNERRLLRQVFNKLRGKHDLKLDINELELLLDKKGDELLKLLNIVPETVTELQRLFDARNSEGSDIFADSKGKGLEMIDEQLETSHTCPKCGYSY